jgi:uncharacterized protein (TIGR02996 family)
MTDDSFLRAILENPDDDGPRLVYADWLDEQGGEEPHARARLIRAQCESERLSADDPRRRPLEQQAQEVLDAFARRWTEPVRKARLGTDWVIRRGLLEGVTLPARRFVVVAEGLFRLAPTLCAARFPAASNEVAALARCPHLARLTEVDLRGMCGCGNCPIDEELAELFASPHAANLRVLNVAGDRIDLTGASRLATSQYLARLTALDLSGNRLGTAGVRALTESPHLTGLTRLALRGNGIGAQAGKVLADWPGLARLTTLDLSHNRLGNTAARALLRSPHAGDSLRIDLRSNGIDRDVARLLPDRFGKRVRV